MKIINVETICLAVPLEKPVPMSFGLMTHRKSCLVHIETDEGIDGWGESFTNHPHWALEERKITIDKGLKPLVVGEDPLNINKLLNKMYNSLNIIGLQSGARGQFIQAMSGIDIALWDLKGKYHGLPIYEFLGGKIMDKAHVYASGLDPQNLEEQVRDGLACGIQSFKMKVGFGRENDIKSVEKLRSMLGNDKKIMLDANMAWNQTEALNMIKILKNYHIEWVEEPSRCDYPEEMAFIVDKSEVPIAGGENVYFRDGFRQAFNKNIFNIAQPDVTKTGGISEMACICKMASAWGKPWAPHFFGNGVGLAATLQVYAAISGGMVVELDANPNPLRTQLLKRPIDIINGMVTIPDGPGLGIDINEDLLKEYKV